MLYNFENITATDRYKLMSTTVTPRPIAWIVTEDEGVVNLAPFSYFTPLSSNPATLVVAIGHKKDGTPKDTLANILKTKKCTICFVNEDLKEAMNDTGESLDRGISEAKKFGIKTEKILDEYPPIVENVEAAFFCDYMKTVKLDGKTIPIFLELKHAYYADGKVNEEFKVDVENIGRVGRSYAKLEEI